MVLHGLSSVGHDACLPLSWGIARTDGQPAVARHATKLYREMCFRSVCARGADTRREVTCMNCAIIDCPQRADPDGGVLCIQHVRWTAGFMARCLSAIETAITSEDGLDGVEGERLLREIGKWPLAPKRPHVHPHGQIGAFYEAGRDVL